MTTPARASEFYESAHMVVIEAMRRGCALGTGARLAGLSPAVVHKWLAEGEREPGSRYSAFAREVRKLQGVQIEAAERLHATHRETNPAACQWYLGRLAPDTYGDDAAKAPPPETQADALPDASPDDVAKALGK